MEEQEKTILLRTLVENDTPRPAPTRMEFYTPHYEIVVGIGKDYSATIIIDEESYFELMESEEFVSV